ncbi:MAG: hypothetical protein FWC00_02195 [Firmicutes bacterium]|nr:hypothetical protein [Bacillota bacterium]
MDYGDRRRAETGNKSVAGYGTKDFELPKQAKIVLEQNLVGSKSKVYDGDVFFMFEVVASEHFKDNEGEPRIALKCDVIDGDIEYSEVVEMVHSAEIFATNFVSGWSYKKSMMLASGKVTKSETDDTLDV